MRQRRSVAGGTAKGPGALREQEPGKAFDERLSRDVAGAAVRHGLADLPGARRSSSSSTVGGFRVEFVRREGARRMVDFGPSAVAWWAADFRESVLASRPAGALVRVRPPADASPERVEQLRAFLVEAGAVAVKVLPPAAGPATVPNAVEPSPARGIRETVTACAAQARTRDRERLDVVLDVALSAEGV